MIDVIFQFGSKNILVRINGTNCLFMTGQFGGAFAPIDSLQFDYKGVCREFPDLELRSDWKQEAINRFKQKIKELKTEEERINYVVENLKKYGYKKLYEKKSGFRIRKSKEGI